MGMPPSFVAPVLRELRHAWNSKRRPCATPLAAPMAHAGAVTGAHVGASTRSVVGIHDGPRPADREQDRRDTRGPGGSGVRSRAPARDDINLRRPAQTGASRAYSMFRT